MQLTNRILCGLAFSACLLMAQADPPGRVARMSYMYGPVSFLPGGVDDWAAGRLQPASYHRRSRLCRFRRQRLNCKPATAALAAGYGHRA